MDRIEDLWQSTHTRSYWRNGNITNLAQAALDMALWDIKGKRANMPVYQLLGGKVRDAVPLYAHAQGPTRDACVENAQMWMEKGFRHVRVQMGGYRLTTSERSAHKPSHRWRWVSCSPIRWNGGP